ncbi:HNH endonuclease [Paenibacillus polymyxa]|uniref:HphI n=1 Tax=Paenibacillus polymyxa (strain SC2) TaxID=886882 RepID=E3E5B2_PAEPS|nr:HNH endonuclease [Paenibacillus polymyxa]ADO57472.1 hphI [Paenibacillus polymyxa SC2]WPQ55243.1 HNH endonuclease [Paenibacillus polymyxa]CCI70134.1 Type-2 restriction enzyme HphI [Paenibacillus polymyxa M1]
MRYFFVFQNKTYREEHDGGFLWAPKKNKDGKTFHHWTSMTSVKKGDIIFSSYKGRMHSVIIAKKNYRESKKPDSLVSVDNWEQDGWIVDAEYRDISTPIKYKNYMNDILTLQGKKYAPYNLTGRGNTGYLFQITEELANFLFTKVGITVADLELVAKSEDEIIGDVENDVSQIPEETIREQLVQTRVGQDKFKQELIKLDKKCKLCGLDNINFLRASHSKPWRDSNNKERLDKYNGFLFCPAHDTLYDRGYISFDNDGSLLISPYLDDLSKLLMNVEAQMKITLLEGHKHYVKYHREHIFKI